MSKKKRIGRGNSSKYGNTCGRGNKGSKSRSGYSSSVFFIGGQTPLNILFPKHGFKKKKSLKYVNISNLINIFPCTSFFHRDKNTSNFINFKVLNCEFIKNKIFLKGFLASNSVAKNIFYKGGYVKIK